MPFDMLKLAYNEGIKIEYWSFKSPLEGIYIAKPGIPPIIGISNKLFESGPRFRCVLAEELGHHFTTIGDVLPKKYFHYRDRLDVSRAEYQALKWAAEYLIPDHKIKEADCSGCTDEWSLAESLNVTVDMLRFRMGL